MLSCSQKRTYPNCWKVSVKELHIWLRIQKNPNALVYTEASVSASGFTHKQWEAILCYWGAFACDSCWQRQCPVSEAIYWMWWSCTPCATPAQLLSSRGLWIVTEFQHLTYENRLVKGAFYLYSNLQKARRLEVDPLTIDRLIRYGHNHFANISLLILIETLWTRYFYSHFFFGE